MQSIYHYRWKGISALGEKKQGKIQAKNKKEAIQQLIQNDITVLHARRLIQFNRKNNKKLFQLTFTIKLHTLLSQGISIEQAFTILSRSERDTDMQYVVKQAIVDLQQGQTLTQSLKQSGQFSSDYLSMISCAEASNQLTETLQQLRHHLQNQIAIRQQIKKSLRYPLFVMITTVLVVCALMVFVIPQFEMTFTSNGKSLPALTQALLDISRCTRQYGVTGFNVLICILLSSQRLLRHNNRIQQRLYRLLFRLPLISDYYRSVILQQLTQTLSFCLQSGMTLPAALSHFQANQSSEYIQSIIDNIIQSLHAGHAFSSSIQVHTLFSAEICSLIAIAEETNTLTQACSQISVQLSATIHDKTAALSAQIEPIVMIVLSLIIGIVVIAMYLPLFQLGSIM